MKNMAVVSQRGTVTIPEAVRRTAHIHSGDLVEFKPEGDRVILRHMIVKSVEKEDYLSESEWDKLDRLVKKQLKSAEFKSYKNMEEAKLHSRKLMHKGGSV